MALLTIEKLRVEYPGRLSTFIAVDDVDLTVDRGEIVGIVGESGAGKSTIGNAVMGLLDRPGRVAGGRIVFDGLTLDNPADEAAMRPLRGKRIGMIFQDPLTSLNPLFTVGEQLIETIRAHQPLDADEARAKALDLLTAVGIDLPAERIDQYPHQFSGGMRQRVVIALVLSTDPDFIIADEPTTALDVSVQAQILALIKDLVKWRNVGAILVTHDMGVIAETTDRVIVMHRGRIVETGADGRRDPPAAASLLASLIGAVPRGDRKLDRFPRLAYPAEAVERAAKVDVSAAIGSAGATRCARIDRAHGGRWSRSSTSASTSSATPRSCPQPALFRRGARCQLRHPRTRGGRARRRVRFGQILHRAPSGADPQAERRARSRFDGKCPSAARRAGPRTWRSGGRSR